MVISVSSFNSVIPLSVKKITFPTDIYSVLQIPDCLYACIYDVCNVLYICACGLSNL